MTTPSWRSPASGDSGSFIAASCSRSSAPSAACWRSPAHTARRRPRRSACMRSGRAEPTRPSSLAASCPAPAPTANPRTPAGARGSGWSQKRTRVTQASSSCGRRWRWSRTSSSTTTPAGARWRSLRRRSPASAPPPPTWFGERTSPSPARRAAGSRSASPWSPSPARSVPPRRRTCWRPRSSRSRGTAAASGRAAPESTQR